MVQVKKRISLCDDVKKPQLRKVRIIVNDPYATDDSSSDGEEEFKPVRKVKRIVHEINFPSLESPISKEGEDDDTTTQKHIGVRQRKWGKWASEIRHPINKTRDWLGTYNTFEEAVKVYEDKKSEFDALVANKVTKTVSVVSETSSASALTSENDLVKEEITSNDNGVLFDFNFADLQIPDIGFLAEGNGHDLDFDCFLKDDQLDIGFHGFEDNTPTELPDFDFVDVDELELGDSSFAFLDQLAPLNIPCPMKSFAAS